MQRTHNQPERPPSEDPEDGGNGDSGQQDEHGSGDEQSEEQAD